LVNEEGEEGEDENRESEYEISESEEEASESEDGSRRLSAVPSTQPGGGLGGVSVRQKRQRPTNKIYIDEVMERAHRLVELSYFSHALNVL
jgi:hypothetical protein